MTSQADKLVGPYRLLGPHKAYVTDAGDEVGFGLKAAHGETLLFASDVPTLDRLIKELEAIRAKALRNAADLHSAPLIVPFKIDEMELQLHPGDQMVLLIKSEGQPWLGAPVSPSLLVGLNSALQAAARSSAAIQNAIDVVDGPPASQKRQ